MGKGEEISAWSRQRGRNEYSEWPLWLNLRQVRQLDACSSLVSPTVKLALNVSEAQLWTHVRCNYMTVGTMSENSIFWY